MLIPNKHNGYSKDGIRLYHMDSGGDSQPTSGGTQIQELPEWARPYAKATLEKGAALSEKGYQAYDQPRIAGFSPMQLQAQQAAAGMTPSAATSAGIDVAAEAAMRGLGTNYQAGQFQNQFQAPGEYQAGRFGARPVRAQQLQQYQMGPAQQVQAPELQQFQMGPAERVGTDSFTRAGTAEGYMSPYMQNVVDIQQREARRASDIARQGQQAQAVGAGAFGGSRQGLVEAERQRNLATQLGDIQATGQQAAFQNAQQQFNAEQARQLQAQQANQQAGLTTGLQNLNALLGVQQLGAGQNLQSQLANQQAGLTTGQQNLAALLGVQNLGAQQGLQAQQLNQAAQLQAQQLGEQSRQFGYGKGLEAAGLGAQYGQAAQQLGEQSRQYGAGLGLQGLQTALQGAGQLGSLGGQQFQQGMDINKLQSAYGGQQQALRQQGLSQAYEDFQNEQNYPYKQLGFMSDLIRGLPLGQQTTRSMYEPTPGMAQQLGSIGLGAYGLSKFMAEGGMAYADGGSVDSPDNVGRIVSKLSDQQLQQAAQAAQARGDTDQLEAIQSEMGMRASERRGLASGITPQVAERMAGGGVVAFAKGGANTSSTYLDKLSKLGEEDISETPEQRDVGISAAMPGVEKRYGPSATAPYMEEVKKERAGLSKMSDEGVGLGALAASQALLRPGSASRAIAGAMGAFGQEVVKMKKEQREADRLLRQSEISLATAEQARKDGLTGKAEAAYDRSQAQKKEGLDRQIGIAEKQAQIQSGIENSQRQAAATMAGVNKPTDLDKQAQTLFNAKVARDPSIAVDPVKRAETMAEARATAADQLGRYPGSVRVEAATNAAEAKAESAELKAALEVNGPYIKAMQKGDYAEAARIRDQVAAVVASKKPQGGGKPSEAQSITVGGQTYTRPANFTNAQWEAYKASQGVK